VIGFVDFTSDLTCSVPGMAMYNLANTHGILGQHESALNFFKQTLVFFRRVLPENHLQIGAV
jgi:hypothetical protein